MSNRIIENIHLLQDDSSAGLSQNSSLLLNRRSSMLPFVEMVSV